MAKVINPFFPRGVGCLRYKPHKNLKGNFTHVVFIDKYKKREVVSTSGEEKIQ